MTNSAAQAPARESVGHPDAFDRFGVPLVVNCCGIYTDLGGSILSEDIWSACTQLNGGYLRMVDLMTASGLRIAQSLGTEAARVTPGASAAIALAVAATITGRDGPAWERLPDTSGLRDEVLLSAAHLTSYKYAGCARLPGARLRPVGPGTHHVEDSLIEAIGPNTACILIPAHLLDGFDGVDQLTALTARAHASGVPVVVDAAYMCFPLSLMRSYAGAGADLVCFSAKYFGGPNSGGFVAGRSALVEAVEGLDFTRFESGPYRSFGRPFKMSRYDIAATALALEAWMDLDHDDRWAGYRRKVDHIRRGLGALPAGVVAEPLCFTMSEELVDEPGRINCLVLRLGEAAPVQADELAQRLERENPIIATAPLGSALVVAVDALLDGQEQIVTQRLAAALAG